MKKILVVIITVCMAVACKPKDEKREIVRAEISAFEKDWAATGDMMNNWGIELDKSISDTAVADSANACTTLIPEYETALNQWNVTGKAFTDWKARFEKGDVPTEEATATLKDFKTNLETYNEKLAQWQGQLEKCR